MTLREPKKDLRVEGTGEGRKKGDDGETATRDFGLGSLQYSNACSPDRIFKHRLETQSERIGRKQKNGQVQSGKSEVRNFLQVQRPEKILSSHSCSESRRHPWTADSEMGTEPKEDGLPERWKPGFQTHDSNLFA